MSNCFISTSEVASMLSVSSVTVRRWTDSGTLTCTKTAGGHRRYQRSHVNELMQRMEDSPPKPIDPMEKTLSPGSRFYHDINMANTVLRLNLAISSLVDTMTDETCRVVDAIDAIKSLAVENYDEPRSRNMHIAGYLNTLVTALQYEDVFSQKLGAVQAALDGINVTFRLYLSQFNKVESSQFIDEFQQGNRRVDREAIFSFVNNMLSEGMPILSFERKQTEKENVLIF